MTQDIQSQLADLQDDADFDAWADARCAEFEAEEDARHCLGGANDARSQGVVDMRAERDRMELEMKIELDAEMWQAQCEGNW